MFSLRLKFGLSNGHPALTSALALTSVLALTQTFTKKYRFCYNSRNGILKMFFN